MPLLARWPGRVEAGSTSHSLVALTDVIATLAELLGRDLPAGAAPDSFSFLGTMLGSEQTSAIRTSLVHNSYRGGFGIRYGDWKPLMLQGGGAGPVGQPDGVNGWNPCDYDRRQPYDQLYNLRDDLG